MVTKMRGYKKIVQHLPHEVGDLEPVLELISKQDLNDHKVGWQLSTEQRSIFRSRFKTKPLIACSLCRTGSPGTCSCFGCRLCAWYHLTCPVSIRKQTIRSKWLWIAYSTRSHHICMWTISVRTQRLTCLPSLCPGLTCAKNCYPIFTNTYSIRQSSQKVYICIIIALLTNYLILDCNRRKWPELQATRRM